MIQGKTVTAIIQARMGSSRFPGKVLKTIHDNGKCYTSVLHFLCSSIMASKYVDFVIIATTCNEEDNAIEEFCKQREGILCFRGEETNVLKRVWDASKTVATDIIVDITADCPLVPTTLINEFLEYMMEYQDDHVSNVLKRTYPDGFDLQVYTKSSFERLINNFKNVEEHTGYNYIKRKRDFDLLNIQYPDKHPEWELTIDYPEDLEMIRLLVQLLLSTKGTYEEVKVQDYIDLLKEYPALLRINDHLPRHEASNNQATNKFENKSSTIDISKITCVHWNGKMYVARNKENKIICTSTDQINWVVVQEKSA